MRQIIALLTFLAAVVTLATLASSAPMPHHPDLDRRDSVRITGGDKTTPKENVRVYKRDSVRITGEDKKTLKEGGHVHTRDGVRISGSGSKVAEENN